MNPLRELSDMSRDFGLGRRYYLWVGGLLAAILTTLFLWGRVEGEAPPPDAVPAAAPAAVIEAPSR